MLNLYDENMTEEQLRRRNTFYNLIYLHTHPDMLLEISEESKKQIQAYIEENEDQNQAEEKIF